MEEPRRYHPLHVTLHWLIAIGIFINLYLGIIVFEHHDESQASLKAQNILLIIHMAVGVTILLLLLIRLVMRFTVKRPPEATTGNSFLDCLAKTVHYGLYLAVLSVTVIGLIFSLQTGLFQTAFLGAGGEISRSAESEHTHESQSQEEVHEEHVESGIHDEELHENNSPLLKIHEWIAYGLIGFIALHIVAAFYHQFLYKDNLLARMWYGTR